MVWLNIISKIIVGFALTSLPVLYSLDAWRTAHPIILGSIYGFLVAVTVPALLYVTKNWKNDVLKDVEGALNRKLGEIPPKEYLNRVYGPLPKLFIDYISKERKDSIDGLKLLDEKREWTLTTARSYEGIANALNNADHIDIIDQGIKRWREITYTSSGNTFNYSHEILATTSKRLNDRKDNLYLRRVFMVKDVLVEQLEKEISDGTSLEWKDIKPAVKILLIIWNFEKRIEAKRVGLRLPKLNGDCTRVLKLSDLPLAMVSDWKKYKDIVILDKEMIFQEELLCDQDKSSNETNSKIIVKDDYLKGASEFFDKIWGLDKIIKRDGYNLENYFAIIPDKNKITV